MRQQNSISNQVASVANAQDAMSLLAPKRELVLTPNGLGYQYVQQPLST